MRILNVGPRFKPPPAPPHPPSTEQPLVERNPVRSSDPARGLQIHVRSPLVEHAPAAEVHAADHSGHPSIRAEARKRRLFRFAGVGRRYIAVIRRRRRLQRRERLPDPERPPLAPLGPDRPVRPRSPSARVPHGCSQAGSTGVSGSRDRSFRAVPRNRNPIPLSRRLRPLGPPSPDPALAHRARRHPGNRPPRRPLPPNILRPRRRQRLPGNLKGTRRVTGTHCFRVRRRLASGVSEGSAEPASTSITRPLARPRAARSRCPCRRTRRPLDAPL